MEIKIGLIGFGSVGRTTANYLLGMHRAQNTPSADLLTLEAIYTRTPQKIVDAKISTSLIVDSWQAIIYNPNIQCVVELIGGLDLAKDIILSALRAGKHVVTANKALLAHHGQEIFSTALSNNVCVAFEASCGGGIPIINAISQGLAANHHSAIYGVMNGTCNFILTQMDVHGLSFEKALAKASELGLAEADPSLDIDGYDAGHKIALLSSLAFRTQVDMDNIPITGISKVKNKDIFFGERLHYTMKLIAAAFEVDNILSIWVHPAFLPDKHPMKYVDGSFNAISTIGDEVGHTFYYGRGAGGQPTNSAITADLLSIAKGIYQQSFSHIGAWLCNNNTSLIQSGMAHLCTPIYFRATVKDIPGTLTQISSILGQFSISIARVLQEDSLHSPHQFDSQHVQNTPVAQPTTQAVPSHDLAELIIVTHETAFESMTQACIQIGTLDAVVDSPSVYPIINAPQDHLN